MNSLNIIDDFKLKFTSGGDSRTRLHPSGKNKYYSASNPLPDTTMFGSCTSSSVAQDGYDAALNLYRQLNAIDNLRFKREAISECFSLTRKELLSYVMKLESHMAQAILTPSGTDAEYISLWAAWSFSGKREISNILIGPTELGSGTTMAASATYFDSQTPSGDDVQVGGALDPELSSKVRVHTVPIRDDLGNSYDVSHIDEKVSQLVADEIKLGRHVLLHLVAHSKTGIHAPSLDTVYDLSRQFSHKQLSIVIDAAQGRFSREGMRKVIQNEFMVIITGSKFFGGPGFCGSVVIPKALAEHLKYETAIPSGFEKFFTADMFPSDWTGARRAFDKLSQPDDFQLGLLLRWRASLAEIVRYYHTPSKLRYIILKAFSDIVPKIVNRSSTVWLRYDTEDPAREPRLLQSNATVFSFYLIKDKRHLHLEELCQIFFWLTLDMSNAISELSFDEKIGLGYRFQIGQPVALGNTTEVEACVLRIAIGAVQISEYAVDIQLGRTLSQRLSRLEYQIHLLVRKLEILVKYYDQLTEVIDNNNE